MHRPLSVGARAALRYALAMGVVLSVSSVVHHHLIRRKIDRDAILLMELQAREIAEEIRAHPDDRRELERYVEHHVDSADPDLKLGIRVFGPEGEVRVERGAFEREPLPTPERFPEPGESRTRQVPSEGSYPYFLMAAALPGGGVQIAVYSREFARSAAEVRNLFAYSAPIMLLVTVAIGGGLVRGILRPLARITESARRITASRLDERIPTSGSGDELDRLAATLNDMMDRVREGVERTRRFAANAAHELRAPVSLLRNRVEDALERPRDAEKDERLLRELLGDADRIGGAVRAMLQLAHSEAGLQPERLREIELSELLAAVTDFFEPLAEAEGVTLHRRAEAPARLRGDPDWLHQMLANLVDNAIKFTPRGGRVELELEPREGEAHIHVHDTGVGVAPEQSERVFEHFHRVGASSRAPGVGLGLPLAREIARAHGGGIELESTPGQGTTLTVRLPLGGTPDPA